MTSPLLGGTKVFKHKIVTMNEDEIKKRGLLFNGRHLPYNTDHVDRAKEMRKNMTAEEKKLWYTFLKNCAHRFRRQHPIDNYVVDFYCSDLKLVIEIDGGQHYTNGGKSYDAQRDAVIESYGLKIVRFTNADVNNDFDAVCRQIQGYKE